MKDSINLAPTLQKWINPSKESLWSKYAYLEETLQIIENSGHTHNARKEAIIAICRDNLAFARACFGKKWYEAYHPHLAWEFMHRVDEDLIQLIPDDEVLAKAIETKTYFDMNIAENKFRQEWLGREGGEKGRLVVIIDNITRTGKAAEQDRINIQHALNLVNKQVDRTFWTLSQNTMTSVISGFFLILAIAISWFLSITANFQTLGTGCSGNACDNEILAVIMLGLIGTYISNVITKEGYLYVRGGPYWRYFIYHIIIKPALGAIAALFIYFIAQSKLLFVITSAAAADKASAILTLKVPEGSVGYAYCVLAIAAGFASDKIIREMMDKVLKKLAQSAEKTKESPIKS